MRHPSLETARTPSRRAHLAGCALALVGALFASTAVAQQAPAASTAAPHNEHAMPDAASCASEPALHLLDFWLGDWKVLDSAGAAIGTNRVERVLDGCAITETWHDLDGTEDRGVLYYRSAEKQWVYVLITPQALMPGGLRERHLVARLPNGGLRFLGEVVSPQGLVLNRMTLFPLVGGRVREVVDASRDGGTTWRIVFDGFYARATAPPR